jgi:hypothetical protein
MSTATCWKIAYPDAATAHEVARIIRSGRNRNKRGRQTRAYVCPRCHAYHLTSEREITK